jgi:AraC-like DNA-binding protein
MLEESTMNPRPADMAHVTAGHVRVGPLRHLPELLQGFGIPLGPLLDGLGLPADLLQDPENTIAVASGAELLALCAERSRCSHFGLLLGQRASLVPLGLIGALAQNEATVEAALRGLARTQHLHGRAGVPAFIVKEDVAIYSLTLESYLGVGAAHVHDLSAAMGFNLMRDLCGPAWAPTEIMLPHAPPADRRPYDRYFRAPIRFDAEWTAVAFPARWLSHRVMGADPSLRGPLQESVDALAARQGDDLIMRTRRALYVLVLQGKGSMHSVADLMGMHRRTLNRRLALGGTSISEQLEEVKSHIARQLVADTTMSMVEIASTLNYSDAATFTRAFRRWTNMPPSAWRSRRETRP